MLGFDGENEGVIGVEGESRRQKSGGYAGDFNACVWSFLLPVDPTRSRDLARQ